MVGGSNGPLANGWNGESVAKSSVLEKYEWENGQWGVAWYDSAPAARWWLGKVG